MAIGYSTVRVNITAFVVDGIDADDLPDTTPLTGFLTLEPMIAAKKLVQYDDGGITKLKAITAIGPIPIGPTGDIAHLGRDYVKVIAPTADMNLGSLQWKATFSTIKYGTTAVAIDPIYFYAVDGLEINLADEVNVAPSSTAVQLARGQRGYGVLGADATEDGDLVLILDSANGPVESDPIPLPVGNGASDADIAALVVDPTSETKATLDTTYAPQQETYKQLARTPELLIAGTIVRNSDEAATSAPVVWPDGAPGTYTATTLSSAFPGAVDAYTITYGSPVTKTYTQPAVTRNASGAATAVPAIVVS
ncbi:hypothetical protein KXR83_05875 [Williamsia muralis]|uniref:hypothetical protein n=1 Tax=Williamsia marianensis TaxID=85044 RepID=UPI003F1920B0